MKTFSILISTKNRLQELKFTLLKLESLLQDIRINCIICDDGSDDGTSKFIKDNYPKIKLITHLKSKGYIFSRNKLLALTSADYAISLDDDAHFLSDNILNIIENYFLRYKYCGLIAFRVFWGKEPPTSTITSENPMRVKGFVGCGHVWNMEAWRAIPKYPEWFVFYGEEEFASYQLFKNDWQVHYVPKILVQHRVDVSSRKSQNDYGVRLRRSLRSGWYNYFLFLPWSKIPRSFFYTLFIQLKFKVLKGDFVAGMAIFGAILDLLQNLFKLILESNRLSISEFKDYKSLPETKIYWRPLK